MMSWWLDRGIDGFRMDVINFISKDPALPDGRLTPSGYGDGMPYFSYGPQVHAYLAEMRRQGLRPAAGQLPDGGGDAGGHAAAGPRVHRS